MATAYSFTKHVLLLPLYHSFLKHMPTVKLPTNTNTNVTDTDTTLSLLHSLILHPLLTQTLTTHIPNPPPLPFFNLHTLLMQILLPLTTVLRCRGVCKGLFSQHPRLWLKRAATSPEARHHLPQARV
jgi:hypothetical protein